MIFLDFNLFKPSTWLSGTADGVMGAILSGIRTLLFDIVTIVYQLIVNVYSLFEKLCSARLLNNKVLGEMSNRIGLILGLIMFFYVIFSLIQILLNPDKLNDKENGAFAIVKKVIIVVVLLGISNSGFNLLYDIQNAIIDSNAISKIILPYNVSSDEQDNFGNLLSFQLIRAFYQPETSITIDGTVNDPDGKLDACSTNGIVGMFYQQVYLNNKYNIGYMCLNESVEVTRTTHSSVNNSGTDEVFIINFNGFLAVAAGAFVVYMLLMYCFKVGVRMIQLAFLEIISPMAIVGYLSPKKDNMLTKWGKIYFATYIDVFIRIAIINFVIFLICTIFATDDMGGSFAFWDSLGYVSEGDKLFFTVVIILALLTFAKKAPDLIKEFFPGGASKLGFGMGMKDIVGLKEGIGMVTGAATGAAVGLIGGVAGGKGFSMLTGALGGIVGGTFRGGKAGIGAKGFGKAITSASSNQAKANLARAQRIASGSTFGERVGDATRGFFGIQAGYDKLNDELSMSSGVKSTLEGEDVMRHIDEMKQAYIQGRGDQVDYADLVKFDEAKKEALKQMYSYAYSNNSGAISLSFDLPDIATPGKTTTVTDEFKSNQGIHNKIKENEKRSGKPLTTYGDYKDDNNELKNRIADKHKKGK